MTLLVSSQAAAGVRSPDAVAWKALEEHAVAMWSLHLRDLMFDDARSQEMCLDGPCMHLDFARQKVTRKTMELLVNLAVALEIPEKLEKLRKLEVVNLSEKQGAGHHRRTTGETTKILKFADDVRSGRVAPVDKKFKTVIVVGIGGSRLGPELVVRALEKQNSLDIRFLSSVDHGAIRNDIKDIHPSTTLVIVSSKSFTTVETMMNANKLRSWLRARNVPDVDRHLVAVTANPEKAKSFCGRIFEFATDVGGRYSVAAAPGLLPLALAVGADDARRFLEGMRLVDVQLFNEKIPLDRKIPFVMAAIGVWNNRCILSGLTEPLVKGPTVSARAIVPYCHRLAHFPAHIQQLEMESLGKSVTAQGNPPPERRSQQTEVVFGATGPDAQHSFFQLLHQGAATVPAEFIAALEDDDDHFEHADDVAPRDLLMANFFAQADALALGTSSSESSLRDTLPGDRPSSTLVLRKLDPASLGALIAVYEHRTAITGFFLDVNPFDQPGVEHGKRLATGIQDHLSIEEEDDDDDHHRPKQPKTWPPSTQRLLHRYLEAKRAKHRRLFPPNNDDEPPSDERDMAGAGGAAVGDAGGF